MDQLGGGCDQDSAGVGKEGSTHKPIPVRLISWVTLTNLPTPAALAATSRTVELLQADSAGIWYWVESTVTNLVDDPTVRGIVMSDRVVDERKALENELTERALHDSLTGLANRALLRDRLEHALLRRDSHQHRYPSHRRGHASLCEAHQKSAFEIAHMNPWTT